MRRVHLIVLLVLVFSSLALLAGCGGSPNTSPTETTPTTPIPTTPTTTTPTPTEPLPPTTPTDTTPKPPPGPTQPPEKQFPKTPWKGAELVTILVVGSDGRDERGGGICPAARSNALKGTRADALHLIVLNTKTHRTTIINIPRDSYVSIPGHGHDRINASLALGGIPLLVTTVQQLTGIQVDYYVVTTFCGLRKIVDYLGGVVMKVPQEFKDKTAIFYGHYGCSRTAYLKRGWQKLNGCQALFLSRSRHDVPGGDFGRTTNQGKLLIAVLKRFQYLGRSPSGMFRVLRVIEMSWKQKLIGTNIPHGTLIQLMNVARGLKASSIQSYTLRGSGCWAGTASVVCLASSNSIVFRDIRTDGVINGH